MPEQPLTQPSEELKLALLTERALQEAVEFAERQMISTVFYQPKKVQAMARVLRATNSAWCEAFLRTKELIHG